MRAAGRRDGLFERLLETLETEEARNGTGAELYERRGASLELSADEEGTLLAEMRERGLAVRLFKGGRASFAAAPPGGALRLPEEARLLLPRARARRGSRPAAPVAAETGDPSPLSEPAAPDQPLADQLLGGFRTALAAASDGDALLREATVMLGERAERIATTAGRHASWTTRAATFVATVVGRTASGRISARVLAAARRAEELPIARLARHAADRVLLPLTGRPLVPARVDLLLDPAVAAHLVGRLAPLFFGDEEEALLHARTRGGRDPIASPSVTLIDDAGAAGGPVRSERDGEGTPQGRIAVVEHGRVTGRLTDLAAAARTDRPATGNAVRRSWTQPPAIGVTNFFVDPSPGITPIDLLASVTHGYYAAVLLERPDVDLASNRFRLATAGYRLERGRATARVSDSVISGRLSDLLRGVVALGDDLKFVVGAGGGVGSPTLYVPRWRSG